MPRDQRLYMTFPIDFPDHPKVRPLTLLAKWTFIEMNAYSRRHGLDGRIPVPAAHAEWKRPALTALLNSHAERPLVQLIGDEYVIRDYAEHQLTSADIEDLREKRAEAGRKGGKAAAIARANAKQPSSNSVAESESRSESESEVTTDTQTSPVTETPAPGETDDRKPVDNSAHWAKFGISDIAKIQREIVKATGRPVDETATGRVVGMILTKAEISGTRVKSGQAYVLGAVRDSWAEVQQYLDEAVAS